MRCPRNTYKPATGTQQADVHEDCETPADQPSCECHKPFEAFTVRLGAEFASFRAEDGSCTDVPLDVLQRSAQLQIMLSDAEEDVSDQIYIALPTGVLQSWMESLHDLSILRGEAPPAADCTKPNLRLQRTTRCLQVRQSHLMNHTFDASVTLP